jgi:hypothetical protein
MAMLVAVASAAGSGHPALSEALIKRAALKAAARAGDRHPSLIQHAEGTRERANKIAWRDTVPDFNWCYLIVVRGRFVLYDVPSPSGAKPPKGTVLMLVLDAKTRRQLDFGVGDRYPDLAKLGPVTTDLR